MTSEEHKWTPDDVVKNETSVIAFEIPSGLIGKDRNEAAYECALKACPEGWTPNCYFGAPGSFFVQDGKPFARCTIIKKRA